MGDAVQVHVGSCALWHEVQYVVKKPCAQLVQVSVPVSAPDPESVPLSALQLTGGAVEPEEHEVTRRAKKRKGESRVTRSSMSLGLLDDSQVARNPDAS